MRGHWHALGHVFASEKCGTSDPKSVTAACNPISGHLFSRDGLTNWTTSDVEPYSFAVDYDDGTSGLLAPRERPKLLVNTPPGEPTHLYTAASPMPPEGCKSCTHPRKSRDVGSCVLRGQCGPDSAEFSAEDGPGALPVLRLSLAKANPGERWGGFIASIGEDSIL